MLNKKSLLPKITLLPEGGEFEVTTNFLLSLFFIYYITWVTFP